MFLTGLRVTDKKHISAVVISYRGIDFIADCLNSLKTDLAEYEHEIIVVDNHSTDGTIEYIERNHGDVRLIKNPRNLGFARAVNQGIEAARYEYLWLLNQDIRIRKGCLQTLFKCHEKFDRPGVIGPCLIGFDGKLQRSCRRLPRYRHIFFEMTGLAYLFPRSSLFNGWKMGEFDHTFSRSVEQPMGAAMLLSRNRIDEIGMLDETFGIFLNDVDFCRRLLEAGYLNYYCAEAVIEHFTGGSVSRQKPKMVWLSHLSVFRYFQKWEKRRHASWPVKTAYRLALYLAGPALVLSAMPRSLYHLLRRLFT